MARRVDHVVGDNRLNEIEVDGRFTEAGASESEEKPRVAPRLLPPRGTYCTCSKGQAAAPLEQRRRHRQINYGCGGHGGAEVSGSAPPR